MKLLTLLVFFCLTRIEVGAQKCSDNANPDLPGALKTLAQQMYPVDQLNPTCVKGSCQNYFQSSECNGANNGLNMPQTFSSLTSCVQNEKSICGVVLEDEPVPPISASLSDLAPASPVAFYACAGPNQYVMYDWSKTKFVVTESNPPLYKVTVSNPDMNLDGTAQLEMTGKKEQLQDLLGLLNIVLDLVKSLVGSLLPLDDVQTLLFRADVKLTIDFTFVYQIDVSKTPPTIQLSSEDVKPKVELKEFEASGGATGVATPPVDAKSLLEGQLGNEFKDTEFMKVFESFVRKLILSYLEGVASECQ